MNTSFMVTSNFIQQMGNPVIVDFSTTLHHFVQLIKRQLWVTCQHGFMDFSPFCQIAPGRFAPRRFASD